MRKNYFLSLLLLMIAFWNVEAKGRVISNSVPEPTVPDTVKPLKRPSFLNMQYNSAYGSWLSIGWRDSTTDETSYQVAFSTNGVNFEVRTTGPVNTWGSLDLVLDAKTKYWVAVRAVKDTSAFVVTGFKTCTTDSLLNGIPNEDSTRYSCWSSFLTFTTRPNRPFTPTNLTVLSGVTQTSATISFRDVSKDETKFIIKRSSDNGSTWTDVVFMNSPDSTGSEYDITYTDNNLQPYTTYIYQVASWNVSGYSETSVFSQPFRTLPYPPSGPSLLIAPKYGKDSVYLEWTNHAFNATHIRIERSESGGAWGPIVNDWPFFVNWFTDKGVKEGTTYLYRVFAVNEGGDSSPSNELSVTTRKRVGPPAPTNLQAVNVEPTRIDLSWSNSPFGEYDVPTAVIITRSSINSIDGFQTIATLPAGDTTYKDMSVSSKINYWYRVIASNDFGQAGSNIVELLTLGAPSAPTSLASSAAKDALNRDVIAISWVDNSNDEDYFVLERATNSTFTQNLLTSNLLKDYQSTVSIPFEEGVTYYFRIKAVNQYGESPYTVMSSITAPYTAIPNKPYALKATATNATTVALKWSDDSNKESKFIIERSTDGTTYVKLDSTLRNVITYVDTTVEAVTKYWYRVQAVNPLGSSAFSNVSTVTTPEAEIVSEVVAIASTTDNWLVYPNPTKDGVKLVLPENMQSKVAIVTVIDRMNREVLKTKIDANQKEYRLDLSNFSEGTYTISIRTADKQISKRVYKF